MKNRLFYFAACVALALSSVSCSSDDGEDEDNQNQNNNQKKPVDWKHKFHATVTSQNRTIAQLKNEIAEIK